MNSRVAALVNRFKARQVVSTSVMLVTLTLGILIGTVLSRNGVRGNSDNAAGPALGPVQSPQQLSSSFAQVTRKLAPAVVNISSETNAKKARRPRRARPMARAVRVGRVAMILFAISLTAFSAVAAVAGVTTARASTLRSAGAAPWDRA